MENNELFEIAKSVFPQKAVFTAKVFKSEFAHKMLISKLVKGVKMVAARKLSNQLGKVVSVKVFDSIDEQLRTYAEDNIYFK